MARKLVVEIVGDSRSLERSFSSASRSAKGFSVGLGTLAKSAAVIGGVTAAVGGVSAAVRAGVTEFSSATKIAAQSAAAIRSTGGAANVTAAQVSKLASQVQAYSGIDDEAVQAGENLLLTFKNVRNEIGRGNQVFDRATKAAVDLSVAGFGSIDSTAKQLGKALNDPLRGLTALGRAGVTFSAAQREQIKALVASNRTLEAQKIILREVETQVGGSARALGQTLPGQLARLRESFRNTLGDLVGRVAPAVAGALGQFTEFLDEIGRARTVGAKITLTIERLQGLATALTSRVGDAVADIDWDVIWQRARGIADGLQRQLEQVDFSALGQRIGDAFSDAAKVALPAAKDIADRISRAIDTIDWERVGRSMGPGLAAAVATAFVTLLDPAFWARNWDLALAVALAVFPGRIGAVAARIGGEFAAAVARALGRVAPRLAEAFRGLAIQAVRGFAIVVQLVGRALSPLERLVRAVFGRLGGLATFTIKVLGIQAALNAIAGFARTVGGVFSRLGDAIGSSLDSAWESMKRSALRAALAVIEPFTHIPGRFGDKFRDAKDAMKRELDGSVRVAQQTATQVQAALNQIKGRRVAIDIVVNTPGGPRRPEEGATGATTAVSKNARSIVDAVTGAVGAFQSAVARANSIAKGAVEKAAASGKDTAAGARRAAAGAKRAAEQQRDAFDSLLGSLGLQVDRAAATRGFADDLRANTRLQAAIRQQIRVEGETTDLAAQLFQAQQARSDILANQATAAADARAKAAARIQESQFKALGLTGTGDTRTPGVPNLRKQLEQLTGRLGQDVAPKIAAQLKAIGRVLALPIKEITEATRRKIVEMFQTIRGTFDSEASRATDGPGFRKGGFKNLVEGISGLTPQQVKQLRSKFVQFGPGGSLPSRGFGAFGMAFPQAVTMPGAGGVTNEVNVFLGGRQMTDYVVKETQKRAGSSAASRRGTRPGSNRGLG